MVQNQYWVRFNLMKGQKSILILIRAQGVVTRIPDGATKRQKKDESEEAIQNQLTLVRVLDLGRSHCNMTHLNTFEFCHYNDEKIFCDNNICESILATAIIVLLKETENNSNK